MRPTRPSLLLAVFVLLAACLPVSEAQADHAPVHAAVFGVGDALTLGTSSRQNQLEFGGVFRGQGADGPWGLLSAGARIVFGTRGSFRLAVPVALGRRGDDGLGLALGSTRMALGLRLTEDTSRRLQLSGQLEQWLAASEPGLGLGRDVYATGLGVRAGLRLGATNVLHLTGGLAVRLDYGSQLGVTGTVDVGVFVSPAKRFMFGAAIAVAPRWSLRGSSDARWAIQVSPAIAVDVSPRITATLGAGLPVLGDEPWMVMGGVRIRIGPDAEDCGCDELPPVEEEVAACGCAPPGQEEPDSCGCDEAADL